MTVAFLEKVFLKKRKPTDKLRGVELFNLNLLRDLAAADIGLSIAAHESWRPVLAQHLSGARNLSLHCVSAGPSFVRAACAALKLVRESRRAGRFRRLIIGNAGNGIVPAVRLLTLARAFDQAVVISHREPQPLFLKAVSRLPGHIVCVCGPIAEDYRRGGVQADIVVDYGVMNGDAFHPPETPRHTDGIVRACVLGALDNAWKGADTACEAYRQMPEALRRTCELHLMAFSTVPAYAQAPGIHPHGWVDFKEIPAFLHQMDIMLVPSRDEEVMRETFSQATVQGMLTGLPILYADLPILNEKFDAGGGIRFTDAASLSHALAELIQDPARRAALGAQARRTALARYLWSTPRFIERYLLH